MALALNQAQQSTSTPIDPMEAGVYIARVVQIIDLGKQYKRDWKTDEIETYDDGNPIIQPQAWINFEIPDEMIEVNGEQKPRWVGKKYTISTHEKAALTKLIKAAGKSKISDLSELLGEPVMVEVGMTSGGKNKVSGTSPMMKGMEAPDLINEPIVYDIDTGDADTYEKIPNFLKKIIEERVQ